MGVSPFIPSPATDSTVNDLIVSWNREKGRILYKELMERGIKVHRPVETRAEALPIEGTGK